MNIVIRKIISISKPKSIHQRNSIAINKSDENKIEIDQVLAKVAYGDEELKDNHLLENPDTGDFTWNAITHTYTYRELSAILRDQQHTFTDFMYKLFLVSINVAKLRQAKSYPVFKSLLHRVRVNSWEVLFSSSLSWFRMRALLSYLELSADMEENSLISDHIPESAKKRLTTNNLRYQSYDPAYDHPPGIVGNEADEDLNRFAMITLKKIEINKPETASAVPKYLYRILSLLYTWYNKQEGSKITTGVGRSIAKWESRICRAMVLFTQGKRSKTALNDMIKELEQIEFAKNINKKFFK